MVLEYLVRAINLGLAVAQHDDCQDDTSLSWSWLARLPSSMAPCGWLAGLPAAALLSGENLIKPALIRGCAATFLLMLVGIIGGMQSFGLLGPFLGP
jgi:hypothetical protein